MKNMVMIEGDNITVTAPYNSASGQGVLVGSLFGVASSTVLAGAALVIVCEGVYRLAKTASQTFAQGAKVYWDDAARAVTAVASGNTLIGVAIKAAAGGDATADVRLGIVA